MSTQRKCLSSVLVCVTEFLIAESIVFEGTCYQTNSCSSNKFKVTEMNE